MKLVNGRLPGLLVALLAVLILPAQGGAADARVATYHVTITTLTDGQPFSPPVLATHRAATEIFDVGEPASGALQAIAENGNNGPMLAALAANRHVLDVTEGAAPLVPTANPGNTPFDDTESYMVDAERGAKFLSIAFMLICTNDGFSGVDGLRLPQQVGDIRVVYTNGYDAGTEINTEDFADMVPPCQGLIGVTSSDTGTGASDPALAENTVITHHAGIMGGSDLVPNIHGWSDPVARIEVECVN